MAALQQAASAPSTLARFAVTGGRGHGAFAGHQGPGFFSVVGSALDFPFRVVLPNFSDDQALRLGPRAACVAATTWAQLVAGALVPAAMLALATRARSSATGVRDAGGGVAAARPRAPKPPVQRCAEAMLGEEPALVVAWAAEMTWLGVRTAALLAQRRQWL